MDIYFCGSIRGGRSDADLYETLIDLLSEYGTVLTEHIGNSGSKLTDAGYSDAEIHDQDIEWLNQADIVIAETTVTSLGVGYELGRAVAFDLPILALYRPEADRDLSAMIQGSDAIEVVEYERPAELTDPLGEFVDQHS